jgi:hypothetical protein
MRCLIYLKNVLIELIQSHNNMSIHFILTLSHYLRSIFHIPSTRGVTEDLICVYNKNILFLFFSDLYCLLWEV